MLVGTTDTIAGKRITKTLGVVHGDGVLGKGIESDNIETITRQMVRKDERMGANTIVEGRGYSIGADHPSHCIAYGTAVVVEDEWSD